ncbi:MAG TPA: non-ribosomal peptide synthetase [Allosphingosinicella sp.]|nr:non-ribosomal peptide synthetase [Allosphingosinicella sp.]
MAILAAIRTAADKEPQATALLWPGGSMSYSELIGQVDGLASDLRSFGVGRGARLAVYFERSPEMIVAILGTLAAGAAYIPLDIDCPYARLRRIVEDARPAAILASDRHSDLLGDLTVHPAADWSRSAAAPFDASGEGPAYLIYTSGSTGQPKGVVVEHAALENYLDWACGALPRGEVPLFTGIAFDFAVSSLYPPLMRGDPLYLLPPLRGGRDLAAGLLDGRPYGYVKLTPSHCRLLSRDQRAALGRVAQLVMFGGEPLTAELVGHVRRDRADLRVINHYGPTECTVGCCVHHVPLGQDCDPVPIGRPIPGMRADIQVDQRWIRDQESIGELWIAGPGLALGYWDAPDLTDETFVRAADGQRWYRTGDLAARDDSGAYRFCGRLDHQVKILGHRLEPREVELALARNPAVADCVVLAEQTPDRVRIVAAAACAMGDHSEATLIEHLRSELPAALIPSRIIVYERLPILASGKVDRARILRDANETGSTSVASVSEEQVTQQFRHALGLEAVDRDSDFFDLGGDSLAAMEIASWASQSFGVELDLSVMFECPTVRSLTALILKTSACTHP